MIFFIKKITANGKTVSYIEDFDDISEAIEFIEAENSTPLNIIELKWLNFLLKPFFKPKINTEEIIEFLENLHLIIRSGIPIQMGIEDLIAESKNIHMKKMMRYIYIQLQNGKSLSQAVEKYQKIFTPVIISLIKIGEQTGTLEDTLKKGADFLRNIEDIKKKVKQAMIYPIFAFIAITAAMLVWLLYVTPKLVKVFKDMNVKLPEITVIVIKISNFLQYYFWIMTILFVLTIIAFILALKNEKLKYHVHKLFFKIPILKLFIIYFNTAFFAEYMKLTVSSGLPLIEGLKTLKNNTHNEVYKKALEEILEDIQKGSRISDALKKVKLYPLFTIRMISIGEDSGGLEEQLKIISDFYYDKINYMAQNMSKLIEPIMVFILGGFMALIMLALFGPVYILIGKISGS
jgi:type II secretory pathway component PulF